MAKTNKNWYKGLTATAIMLAMAGAAYTVPAMAIDFDLDYGSVVVDGEETWQTNGSDQYYYLQNEEDGYTAYTGKYTLKESETVNIYQSLLDDDIAYGSEDTNAGETLEKTDDPVTITIQNVGDISEVYEQTDAAGGSGETESVDDTQIGGVDEGLTVQLQSDVQANVDISSSSGVTLDLNGYILEGNGDNHVVSITNSNAAVTSTAKDESGEIANGTITGGGGNCSEGGGIYVYYNDLSGTGQYFDPTISIDHINVQGNTAARGRGGGIALDGNENDEEVHAGTVEISYCVIQNNTAQTYGGGIYIRNVENVSITDTTIDNNTSVAGGGIYTYLAGDLEIENTTISNNTVSATDIDYYEYTSSSSKRIPSGVGGGIYIQESTVNIKDSIIESNHADEYGNVTYDGQVRGTNASTGYGGGVCISYWSDVSINGTTIQNNTAKKGAGVSINGYSMLGVDENKEKTSISADTVIRGNVAEESGGGMIIYAIEKPEDVVISAIISGNTVTSKGGRGGGIYFSSEGQAILDGAVIGTAVIDGETIAGNYAYGGGGICVNTGYVVTNNGKKTYTGGTVIVKNNTIITGNTALYGGGVYSSNSYDTQSLQFYNSQITQNTANFGGGIFNSYGSTTITDTQIKNNESTYNGGGIANSGGTVTTTRGEISQNTANVGGGIYNSGGIVTTNSGEISQNTAKVGGGVYNYAGTFSITDGKISQNTAEAGGGIYNDCGYFYVNDDTEIIKNTADYGGGIYNFYGAFLVNDGLITENKAKYGGGVYNDSTDDADYANYASYFIMYGGKFYDNTADEKGDDAYNNAEGKTQMTLLYVPSMDVPNTEYGYKYIGWYLDGYEDEVETPRFWTTMEDGTHYAFQALKTVDGVKATEISEDTVLLDFTTTYAVKATAAYTVVFVDEDEETVFSTLTYKPMEETIVPDDPTKEADEKSDRYLFAGWSPTVSKWVVKDAIYIASYTPYVEPVEEDPPLLPEPEEPYIPYIPEKEKEPEKDDETEEEEEQEEEETEESEESEEETEENEETEEEPAEPATFSQPEPSKPYWDPLLYDLDENGIPRGLLKWGSADARRNADSAEEEGLSSIPKTGVKSHMPATVIAAAVAMLLKRKRREE